MAVVTYYETRFAPYDNPDPASMLLEMVKSATSSVHIDIYGFTYVPLMNELIAAHQRGVKVLVVADHSQSTYPPDQKVLQDLINAQIDVLVANSSRGNIDHSKYLIVDADLPAGSPTTCVAFGSFNFTFSALAQDNTLTKTNDSLMVAQFLANWQRVHDDASGKNLEWQITAKTGEGNDVSAAPAQSEER